MKENKKKQKNDLKKTLIIVDVQYDFCNPEGALYVKGGENVIPAIIDYVNKNKKDINQIIFTRDWHTIKDKSFEKNGGQWPVHCVKNTMGAQIDPILYKAMYETKIPTVVINKGTIFDHEEYGAFEHCSTFHHLYPESKPLVKNCYYSNAELTSGTHIKNDNIILCGIAGDYCVKETIKNLIAHWPFKISILLNGVASIDGGETLENFIYENNLNII